MMETQKTEKGETVGSKELASELVPILKEFFVADVKRKDDGIVMTFLNGQTFALEIREN